MVVSTDHLNGSAVTTNASGTPVEVTDYYPYGSIRLDERSGTFNGQRKYVGQAYDQDTGLNYMNARYENGGQGQFVSQDPAFMAIGDESELKTLTKQEQKDYLFNPQQLNSYSYAQDNPIKDSDSAGNSSAPAAAITGVSFVFEAFSLSVVIEPVAVFAGGVIAGGLLVGGAKWAMGQPGSIDVTTPSTASSIGDISIPNIVFSNRFSPKTKQEVGDAANGKCVYCGQNTIPVEKSKKGITPPGNQGETDHYIPKAEGGSNDPGNAEHSSVALILVVSILIRRYKKI